MCYVLSTFHFQLTHAFRTEKIELSRDLVERARRLHMKVEPVRAETITLNPSEQFTLFLSLSNKCFLPSLSHKI